MVLQPVTTKPVGSHGNRAAWIWLATLLAGCIFISSDSFWIDEGNTAYKASQPTLSAWFVALTEVSSSDAQMPGYMLYMWLWEKLAGHSELALRMSNLPWLILLILAVRHFPFAAVVALTSPFILNYLNELRPYLMQIAGAAIVMNGLSDPKKNAASGWNTVLAGCLIMSASSLLGVIWSLGALIYVIMESPSKLTQRWFWTKSMAFLPGFAGLCAYYAWTLAQGQGAAQMGGGFLVSMAAAGYELLGLAGLGPGKGELRVNPKALLGYGWILIPATLLIASFLLWSVYQWISNNTRQRVVAAICGIGVPIVMLFALVLLKDFRVLGRHLAPLAIMIVLLIAKAASPLLKSWKPISVAQTVALLLIMLATASSLSLRFAPRHRKDDYRGAVAIAKESIKQQRPVIWVADRWTAYFYGLSETHSGWQFWRASLPMPDLNGNETVLMTKPDIYDSNGTMKALLKEKNFIPVRSLQAFTVFERRTSSNYPHE